MLPIPVSDDVLEDALQGSSFFSEDFLDFSGWTIMGMAG